MNYETQAKQKYSRIGLGYVAATLIYLVVLLGALLIGKMINHNESLKGEAVIIVNMATRFAICYPLTYLLIRSVPKFDIPKKKLGVGNLIICAIISYTLMYLSNLLGLFLNTMLGKLTGMGAVVPLNDIMGEMSFLTQILIVAILGPIMEELVFRKFIIDRVRNYGEVTAMMISAVMFGLYHENFSQFIYATIIGIFFAFIYMRTGKIIYTMILHIFVNGFNVLQVRVASGGGVNTNEMIEYLQNGDMEGYSRFIEENGAALAGASMVGTIVIMMVIAGIVLMIVKRKKFVLETHPEQLPKGAGFRTSVINPGMLLYIIYFVVTIVLVQFGINWGDSLMMSLGLL